MLAAALAVRAPRLGHVFVDLATIRETAAVDGRRGHRPVGAAVAGGRGWVARLAASPLVAVGEDGPEAARCGSSARAVPRSLLARGVPGRRGPARVRRRTAVDETCAADVPRPPAASTGCGRRRRRRTTASARRAEARRCGGASRSSPAARARARPRPWRGSSRCWSSRPARVPPARRARRADRQGGGAAGGGRAREARSSTPPRSARELLGLERLDAAPAAGLAARQQQPFRHHRGNRLPHEVVIVDETSMVSLSMMARLVEAVRPEARLMLVGDPGQLTSIEAGAVLSDIVRAGREGVVVLDHVFRFGAGIGALAAAIRAQRRRRGDGRADRRARGRAWIPVDIADPDALDALAPVRDAAVAACARGHRRGARGGRRGGDPRAGRVPGPVRAPARLVRRRVWMARIEGWLEGELERGRWYPGRPLLVTENDYGLRLYNGDTGVIVATRGRPRGRGLRAPRRGRQVRPDAARRRGHGVRDDRAQGPGLAVRDRRRAAALRRRSQILTRELLYTAVTRAQRAADPRRAPRRRSAPRSPGRSRAPPASPRA